jgi:arylsulfatase A
MKKTFSILSTLALVASRASADKPNILLIFADDIGTGDVPGFWEGAGLVNMPNLENFITKATVFTDAHGTPLCSPSRYTLLSGNYQHRGMIDQGTWDINYEGNQFLDDQMSIAEVLRDYGGYHTSMVGKWHIGGKIPTKPDFVPAHSFHADRTNFLREPGHDWSRPLEAGPQDIGFDSSYVTNGGLQIPPYSFMRDGVYSPQLLRNLKFWEGGEYAMPGGTSKIVKGKSGEGSSDWDSTVYNQILVEETTRFIDDHMNTASTSDKPFFSYVALGAVHRPHSPAGVYLDGTPIAGEYQTTHMDVILEIDKVIGSFVTFLEQKQIMENTLIIFASDNGGLGKAYGSGHVGHNSHGPLRSAKGSIYEGGHRIPLMMRWDGGGIPAGEKRSGLIGLNDMYSTLCDIAGIPVPNGQAMDSMSFKDYILDGDNNSPPREYLGVWKYVSGLQKESIRKNNYKLVKVFGKHASSLYDLDNDISETTDIKANHTELVKEMSAKLRGIGPCVDYRRKFRIKFPNGKKVRKGCAWFQRKKFRCQKFQVGQWNCRRTCGSSADIYSCGVQRPDFDAEIINWRDY